MNRPIRHLFIFVLVLFGLLIVFTSRWTVFERASLNANPLNRRQETHELYFDRGEILADNNAVLARSVPEKDGYYRREYPYRSVFEPALGYSIVGFGRSGVEQTQNAALTGENTDSFQSLLDRFTGQASTGSTVVTTFSPSAQEVAMNSLAGHAGSVVAIEPSTGAVRVLASSPSFDPNVLTNRRARAALDQQSDAPFLDRATQAAYAPGSTFKVVTAIAAINSGLYNPSSVLNGASPILESDRPLSNFHNEQFGEISLTEALTFSVNTVWAQVANHVGKHRLQHYMSALGFERPPPIDLPSSQTRASGEYLGSHILPAASSLTDLGRLGIGQDRLEVTPLQMAMVAAAVANGGRLMKPYLVSRIVNNDGRTLFSTRPTVYSDAFSQHTAAAVTEMMASVVREGTGTAAALAGIEVAGKTGTAETAQPGLSQVWFIAFAPIQHPVVAVAATLQESNGQGGTVAAPIAKSVIQALLASR